MYSFVPINVTAVDEVTQFYVDQEVSYFFSRHMKFNVHFSFWHSSGCWVYAAFFLRTMLGTRYGAVGTQFL